MQEILNKIIERKIMKKRIYTICIYYLKRMHFTFECKQSNNLENCIKNSGFWGAINLNLNYNLNRDNFLANNF